MGGIQLAISFAGTGQAASGESPDSMRHVARARTHDPAALLRSLQAQIERAFNSRTPTFTFVGPISPKLPQSRTFRRAG